MTNHLALSSRAIRIVLATILIVPAFAAAQTSGSVINAHAKAAQGSTNTSAGPKTWTMPRTPDGRPDLHGYWTSESFTPLERPAKYQSKEFLTDAEAEAAQKAGLQRGFDRTYDDPVEEPVYDS